MREPDSNRQSQVQSLACYRYTIPLCNTLPGVGRRRSTRQRKFTVLQIFVKPSQVLKVPLHGLHLIFKRTKTAGSGIITVGEILKIPTTAGNAGFDAFQFLLPLR